jgi:hypothetical protein
VINGVVALIIGLYLILAVYNDNDSDMIKTISEQTGFIKWAGALLVAAYIYSNVDNKSGEIIKSLIAISLLAMLLNNGGQMFKEFNKIGGNKNG